MTTGQPQRPEESYLLQAATDQDERSVRQLAPMAGMSEARWRQILKGRMTTAGHEVDVVAPAATIARMALVLRVKPAALRKAGRDDAADMLEKMLEAAERGDSVVPLTASGGQASVSDEIDLIYASRTMTAREKLLRIKQVLQLQAEVEREEAAAVQSDTSSANPSA